MSIEAILWTLVFRSIVGKSEAQDNRQLIVAEVTKGIISRPPARMISGKQADLLDQPVPLFLQLFFDLHRFGSPLDSALLLSTVGLALRMMIASARISSASIRFG